MGPYSAPTLLRSRNSSPSARVNWAITIVLDGHDEELTWLGGQFFACYGQRIGYIRQQKQLSQELTEPLKILVKSVPGIRGVVLADLAGQEISVYPRERQNELRNCAAYGGIALRRLSVAERLAGRSPVQLISLQGEQGAFLAISVAGKFQLVATLDGHYAASQHEAALLATAAQLEASIETRNDGS